MSKAVTKIPWRFLTRRRKNPVFVRQESWRYKRVSPSWRRPKGIDSSIRLQKSGSPPLVKIGYGSPRKYRGLHPSGLREVLVHNLKELEAVRPGTEAVRLAAALGKLKRMKLFEMAQRLGVKVLNPPVKERPRPPTGSVSEEAEQTSGETEGGVE